ncbi:MAG: hypothetical protein COU63_03670 [Candidatus Pacebacteria bacterium CG10_big_fil_rev_8_21_14_0_10_36_11]|nr:hypothetical protein [Candidatus Pacearchaeota archaeon]OIP73876.1 MAG: hypothetical protein AUK08_04960 [Candidatus Pacebacteria bacterium CG2_30_36_39]PIR64560.1 MAG: hypothetical protein COU63_03670 [Candidatus Pacebacteria bacterium CG10_big_fil_rev_8_21_14_0_10_36_11]PJC42694.1 MAG: hypothetical protein CO040_03115 [Candidatus Pacebacteria bacterium CG_4_9_14_0_2_um_filter_36_8]
MYNDQIMPLSNSLKKTVKTISSSILMFFLAFSPANAQTQAWTGVCVSTRDETVATIQGFQCLLANVLSGFLTLVGMAGFITLIVAGIRILLSGGNSQALEKSKSSITFAILGLIVALSAFMILNLVAEFTGVKTILNFVIPDSNHQW